MFEEDGDGNTPVIQGAYMTLVVSQPKLTLHVIKSSSFSACHSVKAPRSKSLLRVWFTVTTVLHTSQNSRATLSCSIVF